MLFGPKQRLHSGRIPDHCDWPNLRKALTMYRLSEHSLAIEKGRRRQTWLSREDRLRAHCPQNEVETELHFLTSCPMYDHIRDTYFPQITQINKEFENKPNFDKLPYLLGEIPQCAITAARFVTCCHKKRATREEQTPLKIQPIFMLIYFPVCTLTIGTLLKHWNFCMCNVYC